MHFLKHLVPHEMKLNNLSFQCHLLSLLLTTLNYSAQTKLLQNHRINWVERDPQPWSPTPDPQQDHPQESHQLPKSIFQENAELLHLILLSPCHRITSFSSSLECFESKISERQHQNSLPWKTQVICQNIMRNVRLQQERTVQLVL